MSKIYLQYVIPFDKAQWLRKNYPNAYLLLSLIAERSRRYEGHEDGLIIGDALIGDPSEAGLSRQNYRTALKRLVQFNFIKIIHNGKKFVESNLNRKSTIKVTITGTLVNLCDTSIWDINPEYANQHANQRLTNDQPTPNHELIRKNKEEVGIKKKPTPSANAASLLDFFNKSLQKNIPEVSDLCKSKTAIHFDFLLKSYSQIEIQNVVAFCHTDAFWSGVVHDPNGLKRNFSKVMVAMRREQNPHAGKINGHSQKPSVPEYKPEENPKFKCRDPFAVVGISGN